MLSRYMFHLITQVIDSLRLKTVVVGCWVLPSMLDVEGDTIRRRETVSIGLVRKISPGFTHDAGHTCSLDMGEGWNLHVPQRLDHCEPRHIGDLDAAGQK